MGQVYDLNKLSWLGHMVRMLRNRLPRCTLFFETDDRLKTGQGDQSIARRKGMKTLTSGLSEVR